jgi:gamma-glutamyl-gamma-aminobutyrate hydrolase PuuD
VYPERDRAELDLLAAALAARVPVLGICRGLQILNVSRGGTLQQHLPDSGGHRAGPGTFGTHQVRVAPGSRLAGLLGPPDDGGELRLDVPTAHHQAIGRLGAGLVATAWAADGTIEAVEPAPAGRAEFLIAVQWHPEQGTDPRLFRALIRFARERPDWKPVPAEPLDSPA